VVTLGTPQQLINDPIAISEYLGTTFTDNTFGGGPASPPPAAPAPSTNGHGQDQVRWMVEALRQEATRVAAMQELLRRGRESVPPLTDALGRREADLRVHAFEVLQRLVPSPLQFDPYAADEVRAKQLVALRQQLGFGR
jgi:hypothetical protein